MIEFDGKLVQLIFPVFLGNKFIVAKPLGELLNQFRTFPLLPAGREVRAELIAATFII